MYQLIDAVSVFVCCCKNDLLYMYTSFFFMCTCHILHSPGLGDVAARPISPGAWCTILFIFIAKYLELLSYLLKNSG
jgi:hypothetical protein